MRIRYNAPVVLTFTLLALIILGFTLKFPSVLHYFVLPTRSHFHYTHIYDYLRLLFYVFAHVSYLHFMDNFTFILLLGPLLEEKYGSFKLFLMMLITTLAAALIICFFINRAVVGASCIVFMMIILTSFTNFEKREIPLTFFIIVVLFLVKEIYEGLFEYNNISQLGHAIGGIIGALLGFFITKKKIPPTPKQKKLKKEKDIAFENDDDFLVK